MNDDAAALVAKAATVAEEGIVCGAPSEHDGRLNEIFLEEVGS